MSGYNRRAFLGKMGSGMLASAVGLTVGNELDLHGLLFAGEARRLEFGDLEPLVTMMQEKSPDGLMSSLKVELDRGVGLQTLITAGALANARTFGGQNYNGYHAFMAMAFITLRLLSSFQNWDSLPRLSDIQESVLVNAKIQSFT